MENFIKGADLSTLLELSELGARYFDQGEEGDVLTILKRYGFNFVRLRLWNDPCSPTGEPYGAGNCDLPRVKQMARTVKAAGLPWLLDFQYSDFWADPGKQIKPKAWRDLSYGALVRAVHDYTKEVLTELLGEGLRPDMIQIGNELSNGLLWE